MYLSSRGKGVSKYLQTLLKHSFYFPGDPKKMKEDLNENTYTNDAYKLYLSDPKHEYTLQNTKVWLFQITEISVNLYSESELYWPDLLPREPSEWSPWECVPPPRPAHLRPRLPSAPALQLLPLPAGPGQLQHASLPQLQQWEVRLETVELQQFCFVCI